MIGLGIDAGASSSKWALVDEQDRVLLEGRVKPLSGHLFDDAARAAALEILQELFNSVRPYQPASVVAGITGLEPTSPQGGWYRLAIAEGLKLELAQVQILSDMDTAYSTHFAPGEGILIYAGTGSNSYHIAKDGQIVRAGGRGYIVGDDGAGYAIGRAALRQVIHWQETEPHPEERPLARLLYQKMGASEWDQIRAYVYGGGRQAVAALAPSVGRAAEEGDLAAQQILLQAGYDLAQLALLMGRKVGNLPTVLTGGALGISPLIAQAMRSHLPSDIQLEVSQKSIAQGAARMALRAGNPEPRTRNPEPATQNPEPASLPTEQISQAHHNLDTLATLELTQAFVQDQQQAVQAVLKAAAQIAEAVDQAVERLKQGGRLIYAGAGTSGRLSFVDASELPPTFSWPSERAVVAIAGGTGAFKQAVEGAEDDFAGGQKDVLAFKPGPKDVLIGIAASGTTPYVLGALAAARAAGALSIGIANNPQTPVLSNCDIPIPIHTGPEVISGSTRLKAGTAQKITLNTLSSSIMVKLGKVYGNLMVDLQSTNQKLEKRALRLTQIATGASQEEALSALRACGFQVKTAIVMLRKGLDAKEARELLEQHQGVVRSAILSGITLSIWALSQGSTLSAWAGGG